MMLHEISLRRFTYEEFKEIIKEEVMKDKKQGKLFYNVIRTLTKNQEKARERLHQIYYALDIVYELNQDILYNFSLSKECTLDEQRMLFYSFNVDTCFKKEYILGGTKEFLMKQSFFLRKENLDKYELEFVAPVSMCSVYENLSLYDKYTIENYVALRCYYKLSYEQEQRITLEFFDELLSNQRLLELNEELSNKAITLFDNIEKEYIDKLDNDEELLSLIFNDNKETK